MRLYARILAVLHLIDRDTEQMVSDLKDKQIEIIALMNSWVFSRLIAENERAGESLSREMDTVAEAEREQGMSPPASCSCSFLCLPALQALPSRVSRIFLSKFRAYLFMGFGTCPRNSR